MSFPAGIQTAYYPTSVLVTKMIIHLCFNFKLDLHPHISAYINTMSSATSSLQKQSMNHSQLHHCIFSVSKTSSLHKSTPFIFIHITHSIYSSLFQFKFMLGLKSEACLILFTQILVEYQQHTKHGYRALNTSISSLTWYGCKAGLKCSAMLLIETPGKYMEWPRTDPSMRSSTRLLRDPSTRTHGLMATCIFSVPLVNDITH